MPAAATPQFTTPAPTFDDVWRALMEGRQGRRESAEEFDRRLKELSKQLVGHANRLGEFVQEMVRPAAVRLFQERGLPVHQVLPNMEGVSGDLVFPIAAGQKKVPREDRKTLNQFIISAVPE